MRDQDKGEGYLLNDDQRVPHSHLSGKPSVQPVASENTDRTGSTGPRRKCKAIPHPAPAP
jgi:hypothetical protein